jgi:formylmethanofuran dehydrogenase subunit E
MGRYLFTIKKSDYYNRCQCSNCGESSYTEDSSQSRDYTIIRVDHLGVDIMLCKNCTEMLLNNLKALEGKSI